VSDRSDQNILTGVAMISGTDLWAAGSYYPAVAGAPVRALLLHWTGAWRKS
jgi:hypothetical protein